MIRVFLDVQGTDIKWESFREESSGTFYVNTRPYIDVPDDTDLSTKIVENGELRNMTEEEISEVANAKALYEFKAERPAMIKAITVVVDGMTFDGDETSQTRMSRAITVMDDADFTYWTLADNTTVQVTKAQLKQALKLAGQAQTDLWIMV